MKADAKTSSNEDEWMFIVPKNIRKHEIKVVSIPHPGSDKDCKFMVDKTTNTLYEIKKHKDKCSSWLINETVKEDGSIFTVTEFDPLFVVISCLKNQENSKFVLLDQLFSNEKYHRCQLIQDCVKCDQLMSVCDSSGSGEYIGYKYNEDKTIAWLKQKALNIYEAVKSQSIFISATDNVKREDGLDESVLCYACGILGDYVSTDLYTKLCVSYKIPLRTEKRKSSAGNEPKSKKMKSEECNEDYSNILPKEKKTKAKLTKKQRELEKVDKKGMKSISSFFSAKNKK